MAKAIIFDIDGVLIDSYQAHFHSWQGVGDEHDITVTEERFAASFGRTSRDIINLWWTDPPLGENGIRALDDRKEEIFRRLVAKDFPVMDGAVELLDALAADGFDLAVGSSGPPANVELVLQNLGPERFGAFVTGYDVERGKPDPDVFLIAARRLDIPPPDCVVIEDAVAGIEAARAAGMKVVALNSTGHRREEFEPAGPDLIVDSLRELDAIGLRRLIGRERS